MINQYCSTEMLWHMDRTVNRTPENMDSNEAYSYDWNFERYFKRIPMEPSLDMDKKIKCTHFSNQTLGRMSLVSTCCVLEGIYVNKPNAFQLGE